MKLNPPFALALLSFTAGVLAVSAWSAHLGRKVWSPDVFAWPNPFKPQPIIEEQPGSPLRVVDARFYSFMSIGSSVGSVMKLDLKNVSSKPIHSFSVSYRSPDPLDNGGAGHRPETLLQPGQLETIGDSSRGSERVKFSVDFVQFADGDVWYLDPPNAPVKPEGVLAGAQAAAAHLLRILDSKGAAAVMSALPRIRADVDYPDSRAREGGFYYGVTNTEVRVQDAYQTGGLSQVEDFLRQQH